MDYCESTPLQPTGTYSLTHSPMFGIPETLPYSETLFFLAFFLFLSFCPALPPPIRNSASQDPLRACVSCLSCLVSFSSPGSTMTFFTLSLDTDTNLLRNRPHRSSIPLRALLTKTKRNKKQREFTSIAASDQTKKSRCICIIVHIYIQLPLLFLSLLVLLCLLFSQQQQPKPKTKTCPSSSLPQKQRAKKSKKRGFNPVPSSSRLPASLSTSSVRTPYPFGK